jgi:hypothetical protein
MPLKILQPKSFGSAECSITDRINPTYVGIQELN